MARLANSGIIYLGGPIDLDPSAHPGQDWRHWKAWAEVGKPYCPKCECVGLNDDATMEQNIDALTRAILAVFDLRGRSIGTPIEMYLRVWRLQQPAILIAPEGSLFVRFTEAHYPTMRVPNPQSALQVTKEILSGNRQ